MIIKAAQDAGFLKNYKVRVPADLDGVTTVDTAREGAAARAGLRPADVEAIWTAVQDLYRSRAFPGISFCLRRRGEVVLHRTLGHARGNGPFDVRNAPKTPMALDTPVCLFSASKAVTAVLVHKLAEEGGLDLDQRVSHYIPAFGQRGKQDTTVAEVLAHRGGFPQIRVPRAEKRVEILLDWDGVIDRICRAPPTHPRRMAYHAISGGFILAELIQRITGASVQSYLDTRFREPLGLKHFTYGLPLQHRDTAALNYAAGQPVRFPLSSIVEKVLIVPFEQVVESSNSAAFMDAVIPAGNLYATAEELSRFFQVMLDDGCWQGRRLLKTETLKRAVKPKWRIALDGSLMIPMRYSEGMMLGANPVGLYGPASRHAYGHLGFMSILGWADPEREMSCALLTTGKALLGTHLITLGKLLATLSDRCKTG
ncbi:class A beta-lactamase-related serine hydrolase [Solimonas sp. K1W22B-7]|uniref:serine hydrolase domain-containing protein n=1 Tax=Solimonas sp. K1W22B-7 TaxID=2303331 RepID=UPI000E3311D6|nr:serine hydrolase domain-containing protein [Solimonas sp. K1W22B-7]AXQ27451.1 class A beta-lactamase-related serine hydrolase [Solimonas sp. K1W22B-7]